MICEKCGNEIRKGEQKCPRCGAEASYLVMPPPLNSGLPAGRSASVPVTPVVNLPAQVQSLWPLCHLGVILFNALMLFFWFTGRQPMAASYEQAGWVNGVTLSLGAASALLSLVSSSLPGKRGGKAVRLAIVLFQLAASLWALGVFWAAAIPMLAQGGLTFEAWAFALFSLLLLLPLIWMLAHSRA